jgi:WD40 repeat protein
LVAVTGGGSAWLWDRLTGGPGRPLPAGPGKLRDARFSPDGTRLATVGDDGTLLVRDVTTLAEVGRFSLPGTALQSVAFSPDGTRIAVAAGTISSEGGELLLLDAAGLTPLHRLPTASVPLNPQVNKTTDNVAIALAFSPDGRWLAFPLSAGRIGLWDLADPAAPPRSLDGHPWMALDAEFAPDGTMLATSGGDRQVRLWSVPDGVLQGELVTNSPVRELTFSPDGSMLAAATQDEVVRVWTTADRRPLAQLDRHTDELNDVAFDDGGRLISTGSDGTVQVWELDPDRAVRTLCGVLDPATLAADWQALGPDLGDPPHCPS